MSNYQGMNMKTANKITIIILTFLATLCFTLNAQALLWALDGQRTAEILNKVGNPSINVAHPSQESTALVNRIRNATPVDTFNMVTAAPHSAINITVFNSC